MEKEQPARFLSEEQIMSLVFLDRFSLMGTKRICELFDVPQDLFAQWKVRFSGWTAYHKATVRTLEVANEKLKKAIGKAPEKTSSGRLFSEMQIECVLKSMDCHLATPKQLCETYGISHEQLRRWRRLRQ